MWKQTVACTSLAAVILLGLILYFSTSGHEDREAVKWLWAMLLALPLALFIAYLVKRLIEGLAD
jgi:hypothetical protein